MARFLSQEWIDALDAAARSLSTVGRGANGDAGSWQAEQVVTGGPDGPVTYHVEFSPGVVRVAAGPADHAAVRFVQDLETAAAISAGRLNAQTAFIAGRLKVSGEMARLMSSHAELQALAAAFDTVRAATTYPMVESVEEVPGRA